MELFQITEVYVEAFSRLTYRERDILMRRPLETLDKIAASFGLTRERIRQIESDATNKINDYVRSKVGPTLFKKE